MTHFDSKPVNIGIIGSGFAAYTHVLALKHVPGACVQAIAGGSRAAKLSQLASCQNPPAVEDLIALPQLDAVVICSPHFLHEQQTLLAFQHGKHVLVEKPMATELEACRNMIAAGIQAQRVLMVGHFQRYRVTNAAAKQAIDQGSLGRVLFIQDTLFEPPSSKPWEQDARSRGFLLGYGIHAIDRVLWWREGHRVISVYALSQKVGNADVESISCVTLGFDDHSTANITTSNCGGLPRPGAPGAALFQATVIGDAGVMSVDAYGKVILNSATQNETKTLATLPAWSSLDSPARLRAYIAQDTEFVDAIREQRSPSIDGVAGMRNVQVALAAYQSSETRQIILLNEDNAVGRG